MYLIGAILSACLFAVMFRICTLWKADIWSAMATGYSVGTLVFGADAVSAGTEISIFGFMIAGIFVAGFMLRNHCTEKCGVAMTSVTARSSLLIPVLLGWLILGQQKPSWMATILILAGLTMLSLKKEGHFHANLPLLFLIYGLCNFALPLAKYLSMETKGVCGCIFVSATIISLGICIRKGFHGGMKSIIAGFAIGVANTGSIYFSMKALENMDATLYYPIFDGAIAIICTAIGIIGFKERPDKLQIVGITITAIGTVIAVVG